MVLLLQRAPQPFSTLTPADRSRCEIAIRTTAEGEGVHSRCVTITRYFISAATTALPLSVVPPDVEVHLLRAARPCPALVIRVHLWRHTTTST